MKHPSDPHRLWRNGATFYPVGYYPSVGALYGADQPDFLNYYKNLIDKLAANHINYMRNNLDMGQQHGNSNTVYARTGPDSAADGRPRYNLSIFNQSLFSNWKAILSYAQTKDVVIQLTLMDGWHLTDFEPEEGWGRKYDYFNGANNVNGLDAGDQASVYDVSGPAWPYWQAYVRKVVDELGSYPNIVFEIGNETGNTPWEIQLANYLTAYEQSKYGAAHLVMPRDLPGHQYAPGTEDPHPNTSNDPAYTHDSLRDRFNNNLIFISDNDGAQDVTPDVRRQKAWAALTAGAHIDYFHFDMFNTAVLNSQDAADGMRYLGNLRVFLTTFGIDLAGMSPQDSQVNGGWALGKDGQQYIIYLRSGGGVNVAHLPSSYTATWFNPRTAATTPATISGSTFMAPDGNDWVLYIAGH